ncbi:MAG: GTP 3',8-cyclase MoaA [Christensenellales bacterium]|nr:GTP 3',8-cyclase MoaA [Christensenellales bacterium]
MKDQFGREINYLRLSVTDRCNLRCRYCMPEEGVCKKPHTEMLTEDEMIDAVEAAAALGVTKLRITGGEPLVKRNIVALCARAAHVPGIREVCITTNGVLLPKLAKGLRAAGVNRVNLSLDTLDPKKYAHITRVGTLEGALDGLHAALEAGFDKVKINAVLIGGFNDDEIEPLANLTMRHPVDVRFIELMPMLDHPEFGEAAFIPYTRVLDKLPQAQGISPDGGVAKLYRLPGALGNIGLISPVSAHFCAECNRIRLTADGKLKPCLHAADEVSLKGMTREQMRETMRRVMYEKPSCHAELSATQHSHAGRSMNQIGG